VTSGLINSPHKKEEEEKLRDKMKFLFISPEKFFIGSME
jgi:hypothetical protein